MSHFLTLTVLATAVFTTISDHESLLTQIATLYDIDAFKDDVTSIAVDSVHQKVYSVNTVSGTIDIVALSETHEDNDDAHTHISSLDIERTIDVKEESSEYFKLDYMTSIAFSPKGYMVASLIPLNYAQSTGWLVFIDIETEYIAHFIHLEDCYSPKHVVSTTDGTRLVVACEGLADDDIADPEGTITVVDTSSDDASQWRIYSVGFTDFDDCDQLGYSIKHLPEGIYQPKPESPFSVNAEPEWVVLDDVGHYAYISLQENNGVAILDLLRLEMESVFSFGSHDFGFTGLDASDRDDGINIATYPNLFGLRQPDGVAHYRSSGGKQYLFTANEGNAKYYDSMRVGDVDLESEAFGYCDELQEESMLGRLQVLYGAGSEYGQNEYGEFERLYTFGSRDWTAWEIETGSDASCPCDYPSSMKLVFSSLDDMEQVTASQLGSHGFNSDLYSPSGDVRSDDKGPEPESITVGQCSNGDSYVFIGLERAGGVMVYDITDIDDGEVTFVEYLNSRDFTVEYDEGSRPPQDAGNVEPETMIFVPDSDDSEEALLIVGYKTSASIVAYSFNCGIHRQYEVQPVTATLDPTPDGTDDTGDDGHSHDTADECDDQSSCLHVTIDQVVVQHNHSDSTTATATVTASSRRLGEEGETELIYRVCLSMDLSNPYCTKMDDHFTYAATLNEEEVQEGEALMEWMDGTLRCQLAHCSESVSFAVRDGDGCVASASLLSQTLGTVDGIECHASGQKSCHWTVPTPQCAPEEQVVISPVTALIDDDTNLMIINDDASTCTEQAECIHVDVIMDADSTEEMYQICMYWQHNTTHCVKGDDDVFALSSTGIHIEDQISSWESGSGHSICQLVSCGSEAIFGLKDEGSCADSANFTADGVTCSGVNGGYGIDDSCAWTVTAPECLLQIVDEGGSELDESDYQYETNEEQQADNTWHTITNRGGHFYESTVFYVLLAISALTCISVVGCVVKLSKGTRSAASLDLHEEPLEPADWDPENIAE